MNNFLPDDIRASITALAILTLSAPITFFTFPCLSGGGDGGGGQRGGGLNIGDRRDPPVTISNPSFCPGGCREASGRWGDGNGPAGEGSDGWGSPGATEPRDCGSTC